MRLLVVGSIITLMNIDVGTLPDASINVNMFRMEACCAPIDGGIGEEEAADLAGLLKVLADPARLRILSMLTITGEVCACDLEEPLDLSQPTVSHHMKQLRVAGFVESERRGKWVYHRLVPDRLREIRTALDVSSAAAQV